MKLDLFCGLLGSGKTTLIRQMLKTAYAGKKVAVIENEIGKIILDAVELSSPELVVTPLTSGCICCTIQGDFTRAVEKLDSLEHPDYIVIEPTGAADIAMIREACTKVPGAELNRCILVVKANRVKSLLKVVGEFYESQIKQASEVYLNFADTMTQEELEKTEQLLLSINEKLAFVTCPLEEIGAETFAEGAAVPEKSAPVNGYTIESADDIRKIVSRRDAGQRLMTWSLKIEKPLSEAELQELLKLLGQKESGQIWRAKGLLPMQDGSLKKVDFVFDDVFLEDRKTADDFREEQGTLVLIGPNIRTAYLSAQLLNL